MKVAFVFDTVLIRNNEHYYGVTLTYDFFQKRYLDKYDEMLLITRKDDSNDTHNISGLGQTDGPRLSVLPSENYRTIPDVFIKHKKIYKEIEAKIKDVDKVIIRMPSVLGVIASRICRKIKKPYMIECVANAYDSFRFHSNSAGALVAIPMHLACKRAIKTSPCVLYVTNEYLQKVYPTNGKSYACSDVFIDEKMPCKNNKQILRYNSKTIKICTVGNVGLRYKGHDRVLKAISLLKKRGLSIKYYIIGPGDNSALSKEAKALGVEDSVVFVGSVEHNKVYKEVMKADIYVQPSLTEGLPRAVIEAMSVGMIVVGSDAGGIPELLDKRFIYPKNNYKKLASLLESISVEDIIIQSKRNKAKSLKYTEKTANAKRNSIYLNSI